MESRRKNIRLKNYDYNSPGAYFLTLCTREKQNLFWIAPPQPESITWSLVGANCVRPKGLPLSPMGQVVAQELEAWGRQYEPVRLTAYVIMADHVHVLLQITESDAPDIGRMVKQFKGSVTKKLGSSIWQKSYYDHVIRDEADFHARLKYICQNPLRYVL